ncbi:synaptopodin-2 isoform X2 [Pleuronectes platessa]|uniref:synaptopodin-2 isoform X2 n=1 Tax=Pleuronectes platessa TaxID=8262 RepID=UPI00232A1358|nr:synaptopodin-2 isoform X2 [Pleuronectes platessa]
MGTGDYICVTLRGGAPWGFTLREGEGDTYRPFLISQVEEGGRAFSAGVQEGDEVVSLNGEPCAELTLLRALVLIDTSIDRLQLLLKRFSSIPEGEDSDTHCGEREPSSEALASTTLHILSPKHRSQSPRELYISESQNQLYYGEPDSNTESPKGPQLFCTQLDAPPSDGQRGREPVISEKEGRRCFSPGNVVELQVSLSEQTSDQAGCCSLGSALGVEGGLSDREVIETIHTSTISHLVPSSVREPLGQHGVVLGSPSVLGQVEVILQQPSAAGAGRGILSVGGPRVSGSVGSQSEGEEGGGHCEGDPGSFTVSFGIPTDEASQAAEQDSDSEGDPDKPNKHRARHSRLRRSESLSEKQLKEHKSKCKLIALLLTAAPPNPNNKGVLMFKKHRQRAKKYTLVSYGTGEDEPENSEDEDEEDEKQETHTVEFTLVAPSDSELDKNFLTNVQSSKGVLTINWDKGLLDIERNLNNKAEMECLPDTKGKGALMFVQRRQRMDELGAEHDELRRQGIPVEGVPEPEKKTMEQSYMQSTTEGHAYMDVNVHQQSQQQHQYQQYQEQQFHEQQQSYQQQQQSYQQQQQSYQQQQQSYQQQQAYQQYQQQQYEQQHYQQQQVYQQQQEYQQQHQQMQQYSSNVNGTVQHQTNEMQSSLSNRTAKPFSAAPAMCGTNADSVGQGEELASRDERIATPASRTGLLMDARKRNTGKQMFTFKEAPKVSPNPALLNLLNKGDKKLGFESGPEEDYLSLGAEACNFLQPPRAKQKNPPPVAPKPAIDPSSLWSPQIEMNNQDMAQCAENSASTPAAAPTTDTTPAPEQEPTPAPAPEPSPPPAPAEAAASTNTEGQHTWTLSEPESQKEPLQVTTQEENGQIYSNPQPEPAPVTTWAPAQSQSQQASTNSWHPVQVQPQEPPPSQSPPQLPWVTRQNSQTLAQPPPPTNTWTPQIQPSWSQPEEPAQAQTHAQAAWAQPPAQPQPHPQVQPPWAQPLEQPHPQQQAHPPWAQPIEQPQPQPQVHPPWAQPLEQPEPQPQVQPPWAQPLEQPQPQVQPPWAQPLEQPQVQQMQPTWGQPQEPVQQQTQAPWAKPLEADTQPQPPWMQPSQQKSQVQPPWVQQAQPESEPQSPWVQQQQKQAPQQAWPQAQAPAQSQPPWVSAQPQQQQQPSINAWPPSQAQAQAQPPWMQAPQAQPQAQPQANLSPWAPVPAQAQPQPSWPQQPPGHGQHSINSWAQEQNQAPNQPPHWAQPVPSQSTPQPNWQPATAKSPPQPSTNTAWSPAQPQPQTHWAPESQQTPVNVSTSMVNTPPSPKPWLQPQNAPQNRTPPSPPQRMHSFTIRQRASPPINPMATILNPSSAGPANEMPVVRGKGADMFAKRQSRMEKYVVDSETVEANKASRSSSPAASLPNEWKYSPNALGRSYSLSPPGRTPFRGQKSASTTSSPRPPTRACPTPTARQGSWPEKGHKPLSPWEAASRHPLGLVDEAFSLRNLHQTLASNVRLAAQRKLLPEPPAEWKAGGSYQAPQKTGSQTWSQGRSQSRAPLPSFVTPAKSVISSVAGPAGYRSLPRQWQPQRPVTEASPGPSASSFEYKRPSGTYKSVNASNTWSWRR